MVKCQKISTMGVAVLAVMVPAMASAQWLTYTGAHPNLNGTFYGGTGAYAGNVTVQATNVIDGLGNGVPGINPYFHTALSGTYYANGYPTNPGPSLDYCGVTYNDSGDSYHVSFDFTGLANGYLPKGTLMAILDMDISESARDWQALDTSNNVITTPWLNTIPGLPGLFDFNSVGGDLGGSVTPATQVWTGTSYSFMGDPGNQDSAFMGFTTDSDITRMSFMFSRNIGAIVAGGGGYGIAFEATPVPEPCTLLLMGGAGLAAFVRSRKRRS